MHRQLAIKILKSIMNECSEINTDKSRLEALQYALDDMEEIELIYDWSSIGNKQMAQLVEENKELSRKLLKTQMEFYRIVKDFYKLGEADSIISPCTICETDRALCHNCTHNNGDNNLWSYSCGISF